MSLGAVLNVAIGLIFTFLILGLLSTAVYEAVASLVRSRGRMLRSGLQQLLSNGAAIGPLFEKVFGHAVVQSISGKGLPSYVPASSFSLALFDSLSTGGDGTWFSQIERGISALPDGPTKQSLVAFVVEAGGDVDKLRARVELWFNDSMDRLSGVYKRWSQAIHLLFGLVIAVGFNVDSIRIADVLWRNSATSQAMTSLAQTYVATHAGAGAGADAANPALPGASVDQVMQELNSLPIPIGWETWQPPKHPVLWLYSLFGWLITGFAVSLGAPFWFDLLQKVINVRGAGPKPESA